MHATRLFQSCVRLDRDDAIATITLDRESDSNAISNAVRMGVVEALDVIETDPDCRVVVVTGEGEDAFSVGADIAEMAHMAPIEVREAAHLARSMHERLARFPLPIVAALKGGCTGAGLELALHCDIRFARDDTRFGFPGVNIGLTSGGNALWRLTRLIGAAPARALCLTGGIITAERAFMLGLVTNVLKADDFDENIAALAEHLASLSPHAISETKALLNLAMSGDEEKTASAGLEAQVKCFQEGDAAEMLAQMFGTAVPDVTVH